MGPRTGGPKNYLTLELVAPCSTFARGSQDYWTLGFVDLRTGVSASVFHF